jgi:hypothetical protein
MDPLGDMLTTYPIQTGCEFNFERYPSWQFGFIDNPDLKFRNGSVLSRTRTRIDGPEPLPTPGMTVPDSQQTLTRTFKVPVVQKRSTQTQSPIEKAHSGMCTKRSDGKHLQMNQEAACPSCNP